MPKESLKSLRSKLARLKAQNRVASERKRLKSQIFEEKYKAPLGFVRGAAKSFESFGESLQPRVKVSNKRKALVKKSRPKRSQPSPYRDPFSFDFGGGF